MTRIKRRGLTLVELVVANVIVAIALVGVYSVFQHAVALETKTSRAMRDYSTARDVSDLIARDLESVINSQDIPAIRSAAGTSKGSRVLTLNVGGKLRRYLWVPAESEDLGGVLMIQSIPYAGAKRIIADPIAATAPEAALWDTLPKTMIAQNIKSASIRFRAASNEKAKWKANWNGPSGDVAAMIRIRVGEEEVERVVAPLQTGELLKGVD